MYLVTFINSGITSNSLSPLEGFLISLVCERASGLFQNPWKGHAYPLGAAGGHTCHYVRMAGFNRKLTEKEADSAESQVIPASSPSDPSQHLWLSAEDYEGWASVVCNPGSPA